jgi:hypothetical protein
MQRYDVVSCLHFITVGRLPSTGINFHQTQGSSTIRRKMAIVKLDHVIEVMSLGKQTVHLENTIDSVWVAVSAATNLFLVQSRRTLRSH